MNENAYKTREDTRYWPCLLRRLTDFEPEEKKENFAGAITLKQLKKDIFENITMLLNSRPHPQEKELEKWPELKECVLFYGLSDFCGRTYSQDKNEEIREHILKQLLCFEPRLAPDSVSVVFQNSPDGTNSILGFQIQGRIEVGELNEELVFISKLDLETGTFSLKNIPE